MREDLRLKISIIAGSLLIIPFALFFYLSITGIMPVVHFTYTSLEPLNYQTRVFFGILSFFSIFGAGLVFYFGLRRNSVP